MLEGPFIPVALDSSKCGRFGYILGYKTSNYLSPIAVFGLTVQSCQVQSQGDVSENNKIEYIMIDDSNKHIQTR